MLDWRMQFGSKAKVFYPIPIQMQTLGQSEPGVGSGVGEKGEMSLQHKHTTQPGTQEDHRPDSSTLLLADQRVKREG